MGGWVGCEGRKGWVGLDQDLHGSSTAPSAAAMATPHASNPDQPLPHFAHFPTRSPPAGGGGGGTGKRQRASSDAQRPRTDWQKRDDFTWLKVVPPWWCEHRTVHFASEWYGVGGEEERGGGSLVTLWPCSAVPCSRHYLSHSPRPALPPLSS